MLEYPNINPIAFTIAGWPVYWYGIAYVTSFLLAQSYMKRMCRTHAGPVTPQHAEDIFTWVVLGVLLGGRIGYILFYNLEFYLSQPIAALQVWQGGMSFHGGLIGVTLALWIFSKKHQAPLLALTDKLAPAVCIGLFLGRIANFINGELYGRVTDAPWGMVFPHGGNLPRHPSQLYEAALEGILLFVILHVASKHFHHKQGVISGIFLVGYGLSRAFVELFREKDAHLTEGIHTYISQGQILSIPMIALGIYLIVRAYKKAQ